MKKIYKIFILAILVLLAFASCQIKEFQISDEHKKDIPTGVFLVEYSATSLTIGWDFVEGATSYTIQLTDLDKNPISETLCATATDRDYYEFTGLSSNRAYYARVRSNFPYSATSEWAYVEKAPGEPALLLAGVGFVPETQFQLVAATSSTLTYEWSFSGDEAVDAASKYNIELFTDADAKDLVVSWEADGTLSGGKGIFTPITAYPKARFTFSGLESSTTYYARVTNIGFGNIPTKILEGTTTATLDPVTTNFAQGAILVSQAFDKLIHGGDLVRCAAGYNAKANTKYRQTWAPATGVNPQDEGDQPVVGYTTEFGVWSGDVSNEYREAIGLSDWARGATGDNVSTRPGYLKIGGGGAGATIYTPPLNMIPEDKIANVTVSFKAASYYEGEKVFSGEIEVFALNGSAVNDRSVVSGGVIIDKVNVDVSESVGEFTTHTLTLTALTKGARIGFNSKNSGAGKTRFLLDEVQVVYESSKVLEKLATPTNLAFATATEAGELDLTWGAVNGAESYTISYWETGKEAGAIEVTSTTPSVKLTGLASFTQYSAKVKATAREAKDSDWSATVSATTIKARVPLTAPVVTVNSVGYSNVTLSWEPVEEATGYKVTAAGINENVNGTSFTATGLIQGTTYNFSVVALADVAQYNSEAGVAEVKTLWVKVVARTTSSIILEWEKAGDQTSYSVKIKDPNNGEEQTYSYNWSSAKGYDYGTPLRFVFSYTGTTWPEAFLKPNVDYELSVKSNADGSEWSTPIKSKVLGRKAPTGEVFYESFGKLMGGDAVNRAVGVKTRAKITTQEGLSTQFTDFSYANWDAGGGAMNPSSGTYGDPYRLMQLDNDGWESGSLVTGNGVHNAFNGAWRLGGDNVNRSYLQSPAISGLTTASKVKLTFKTAINVWSATATNPPAEVFATGWCRDAIEVMDIYIVHDNGTETMVAEAVAVGESGNEFAWKEHSYTIENLLPTDKIRFSTVPTRKSRYYIDDISIVKQ